MAGGKNVMKQIFRKQIGNKYFAIAVFAIGTVLLGAALYSAPASRSFLSEQVQRSGPSAFSTLSGLNPGEPVGYSIVSGGHVLARGHDKADAKGNFKVPLFADDPVGQTISYNLRIGGKDKPLHLSLRKDQTNDSLQLYGQGLRKFSDIYVGDEKKTAETKADWSGKLQLGIEELDSKLNDDGSFQIALFQNDLLGEIQRENPLTIKIMDTTGGGERDEDGVNEWDDPPDSCSGIRLSICKAKDWVDDEVEEGIVNNYVAFLVMLQEQLTVGMIKYVELVGEFFDAKAQLETQRQFQVMTARAHKDYHPSKQMCEFGTFTKSLAKVEENTKYVSAALNKTLMERYTNVDLTAGAEGPDIDIEARLRQFRTTHCDPKDNNNGLKYMCQHDPTNPKIEDGEEIGGSDPNRLNRDIDFARLVYAPLTLNVVAFIGESGTTDEEEDIIALARNLYWPRALNVLSNKGVENNTPLYLESRRLMAIYNVAHNSLTNLVALKAASPEFEDPEQSSGAFMKALMREFGLLDDEIETIMGESPSYYAQMEMLTKKMYQTPDFYTNLYDKPANVSRIGVSLDAIKLMQMRDWYENALRQEMLASLLVEQGLEKHVQAINQKLPVSASE